MAKKDMKRVSVNAWEKVMKENFDTAPQKVDWHGVELEVRSVLPLKDMLAFTEEVVSACFGGDGTFLPQAEQFAIDSGILTYYAGFAMPESLEKQYDLVTKTDAVSTVIPYIDPDQLDDIIDSAERKIDFLCDSKAMTIGAEMDKVMGKLQTLGEKMEAIFDGVSAEDVQKILASIGSLGEVDEEKIVEAYMKAKADGSGTEDDNTAGEDEPVVK